MLTKLISQIISQQEEAGKKQVYIPKGVGIWNIPYTWYGHITDDVGFKATFLMGAWGNLVISLVLEAGKTYNFNCSCEWGNLYQTDFFTNFGETQFYESSFSYTPEYTGMVKIRFNLSNYQPDTQVNVEINNLPLNEFVLPEGSRN
mgnify:CR=1 FL=1